MISKALNQTMSIPILETAVDHIPLVPVAQEQVDSGERCTICLEKFSMDKEVMKLNCGHCHGRECLTTWLSQNSTCPLCRDLVRVMDYLANDSNADDDVDEDNDYLQEEEEEHGQG